MENNALKIVGALILIAGGTAIYLRVKKNNNTGNADFIVSSGRATNKTLLQTFQPEFLQAWVDAIKVNVSTFVFNGKKYSTDGGKAVKTI